MVLLGAAAGNSLSPASAVPCSAQHDAGICLYPIYTQLTYTMTALFVELPPFKRHRAEYLDDEAFRALQVMLMQHPEAGDVIQGTGGLRKVRFADERRHKGKRGGIRVIYYWWLGGAQFWLFTLYGKDVQDDLSASQKKALKRLLDAELQARTKS